MAHLTIPKIELNSNAWMPQVGYGTWLSDKGKVGEAVKSAIRCGYRHIDCAFIYGNQREIGQAMTEIINKDGITVS
jgi:diketogulonate reductase-like aldo/keto reductase